MRRSTDRILTTHAGRLFRADAGYVGMGMGTAPPPDKLRDVIAELVRGQVDIGVDVISNGEPGGFGRVAISNVIEGFEDREIDVSAEPVVSPERIRYISRDMLRFTSFYTDMYTMRGRADVSAAKIARPVVSGPLKLRTLEPLEQSLTMFREVLDEHAPGREAFYCIPAPAWLEEFVWNEYYPNDDEFIVALSEVMAPMFKAVTDAGFLLQLDDPAISHDWEEAKRAPMTPQQYEAFVMVRVEALNAALGGVPEDMIRFHTCWGSWPGMHTHEIPLRDIVRPMLKVKAQAFSIESAKSTHRSDWKVWRDVMAWPEDKIIIPGVVDHTTNVVEPHEVVADTIIQFANVCGKENVIAGTDCGIRGHAEANWEKYKNIVEGARDASTQLWS